MTIDHRRFDVSHQLGMPAEIAAALFVPPGIPRGVVFCLPGGSYTWRYYHLEVENFLKDSYSFGLYMARRGFLVVAVDHLGTGESTRPPDGKYINAQIVAQANALVLQEIVEKLADGTLLNGLPALPPLTTIGVGHSMGAFLATVQQTRLQSFRTFDALALLGWSVFPLQEMQNAMQQSESGIAYTPDGYVKAALSRASLHSLFYAEDVPQEIIDADIENITDVPIGLLTDLIDYEAIQASAPQITVPVFLGNGGYQDASPDFSKEPEMYPNSPRVTAFVVSGSGHIANYSSNRVHLWKRLAQWVEEVL